MIGLFHFIILISFAFYLMPTSSVAKHVYPTMAEGFSVIPGSTFEVDGLSPIKDQDSVGICYAFSATAVLEHLRCSTQNKCTNVDKDERLSVLDVASYGSDGTRAIEESGSPSTILNNIKDSSAKVAKENCAPYDSLILRKKMREGNKSYSYHDQMVGYETLKEVFDKSRSRSDLNVCAQELQKAFGNQIQAKFDEVISAFNAKTFEEFAYRVLIPEKCRQESVEVPAYQIKQFPVLAKEKYSPETFRDMLIQNIRNQIPSIVNICSQREENGACIDSHSLVVSGVRQACTAKECKMFFKIHNSYGLTWQETHDNGWVDGSWLINEMMVQSYNPRTKNNVITLNWLVPPGKEIKTMETRIYSTPLPPDPVEEKKEKCKAPLPAGRYRCPFGSNRFKITDRPYSCECVLEPIASP